MIEIIKANIKRYVDLMEEEDIVFLKRILISLEEYGRRINGDKEQWCSLSPFIVNTVVIYETDVLKFNYKFNNKMKRGWDYGNNRYF